MSGQRVSYIRVSSLDQNVGRQLDGVAVDRTFTDAGRLAGCSRPTGASRSSRSSRFAGHLRVSGGNRKRAGHRCRRTRHSGRGVVPRR
jgi:hypothetical protein